MKRQLWDSLSTSSYPAEAPPEVGRPSRAQLDRIAIFCVQSAPIVRALAKLKVRSLVPQSGKWANPAEANLVAAVQPIWCRVTGWSAGLTSIDSAGDEKRCRYAEWLRDMLIAIGLPSPATGTIVDVVRSQK
jgi:hypothetical protein